MLTYSSHKFYLTSVFIDDRHPSSGGILVFLITKYNIDTVLSLYHHDIPSCHDVYHYIDMLWQH